MKSVQRLAPVCIMILAAASIASATGVFESGTGWIEASGYLKTEDRDVPAFSRIELEGSGNVVLRQGPVQSLSVETDDNVLPAVKTEVIGGVLHLGLKDGTRVSFLRRLEFRITAPRIEGIRISGSGSVHGVNPLHAGSMNLDIGGSGSIDAELDTAELHTRISGSGSVSVNGRTDRLSITIGGSGGFAGRDLASLDAEVRISGSGSAVVTARDTLAADLSGSGSVFYGGGARPTVHASGSGSVRAY